MPLPFSLPFYRSAASGGLRWDRLLYDLFGTYREAGAVDGTVAEPGPGVRAVVDTGGDVTISATNVVVAGGTSGWGDPRLTYTPTLPDVTGYGIMAGCEVVPTSGKWAFGLANGDGATPTGVFIRIDGTALEVVVGAEPGGAGTSIGTITPSSSYMLAINKRLTQTEYYISGGSEYADWTLIHTGAALVADPVTVGFWSYDGAFEVIQ